MLESTIDLSLILRFGLKCLGVFALIFITAIFTPKMAKAFDEWKAKHFKQDAKKSGTRETYHVRSIYELPPEEPQKKKAVVHKKAEKHHKN